MAHLAPFPRLKFFDVNGAVLVGGQLFSYQAGTSTPLATFTDSSESTPNTNPVILDANGEASVWIGASTYKFVLQNSIGVTLWTVDNVAHNLDGSITTAKLADGSVTTLKIVDGNVTTAKLADNAVTTVKIQDGAVTASKIPDNSLALTKLSVGNTDPIYLNTGDPIFGEGPRSLPRVPWSAPTFIPNPTLPPSGDGNCVAYSPNGNLLAMAENANGFVNIYRRYSTILQKANFFDVYPSSPSLTASWSPSGEYLAAGRNASPFVVLYQMQGRSFGQLIGPNVYPTGIMSGSAWSPDGTYLACAHQTSPYVTIYQRGGVSPNAVGARYYSVSGQSFAPNVSAVVNYDSFSADNMNAVFTGAGWRFTAPRSMGVRVSVLNTFANLGASSTATLQLYKNSSLYSTLDYRAALSGKSTVTGSDWVFMFAGDTIQIQLTFVGGVANQALDTTAGSNHITINEDPSYASLSNFNKIADPATLPTGDAKCCAWSPDSQFLAVGHSVTPFLTVYQKVGTSFVKLANPATLPASQVNGVAWSPNGNILTCAVSTTPYLAIYSKSGSTLTALTNPATLPAGAGNGVAWAPNSSFLAVAHDTTPFVTIYSWDGTTFTKLADPGLLLPGNAKSVSWTPDGKYLSIAHTSSPYFSTYQTSSVVPLGSVLALKEVNLV